jgi:pyrroline-5-carboxylate reductase
MAMAFELDGDLVLVGAGNMGGALLAGWLQRGLDPSRILVQDPSPPPRTMELLKQHGIRAVPLLSELEQPPAVLLMAVKPQDMEKVFAPLAKLAGRNTVILSVAAGRTIRSFERHLPQATAVVRAIPNTPAAVGRGITVAAANAHVSETQKATCQHLLSAVGETAWVDDEALIDPVTAVSGSGPAYVFYLTECLAEAGVKAGLAPELAQKLARWTIAGAGELLFRTTEPADVLRKNVTSPNGTTFAALQVLMADNGLQPLMTEAVLAAARRSKELAS